MSDEVKIKGAGDMPPMAVSLGFMTVNKTGAWRNMRPVLDESECIQCGICWKFCPDVAIDINDYPKINYDYCKGCGICAVECPTDAIVMEEELK